MKPVLPDVTVVVPTIGRPIIERCLRSIAAGSAWPAKLIVVDQQPSDFVADLLAELGEAGMCVEHVRTPHQRFVAAGRNRGFERAETSYVAITDDDCEVDAAWLERLVGHLDADPSRIVTGAVHPGSGDGIVPSTITSPQPVTYEKPTLRGCVLYPNNMACSVAVFRHVGPFDERSFLWPAEDNDWSHRALRAGVPIRYEPDVVVTHLDWRSEDELVDVYRSYARGQGVFLGKHLRNGDPLIAMQVPLTLARAVRRWGLGVVARDRLRAAQGRAFILDLLPGLLAGFRAGPGPHDLAPTAREKAKGS